MDLSRLTARQKRLNDWDKYLSEQGNVQTEALRAEIVTSLQEYRNVLASCWENNSLTAADEDKLRDIERDLERLHEQARLIVVGKREYRAS